MNKHIFRLAVLALPLLQACKVNTAQLQSQVSGSLSCSINAPTNYVITSGVPVELTVLVTGGSVPYSLNVVSRSISISPQFSFEHVFLNTTQGPQSQSFTLQIGDAVGNTADCVAQVTVQPASSGGGSGGGNNGGGNPNPTPTPSALACQFGSQPASPEINEETYLKAVASGGTAPYTFSTLTVSDPAATTIMEPLQAQGSNAAVAAVSFANSGTQNITALLTDANGSSATCALSITVRDPMLQLTVNPASGIALTDQTIAVTVGTTQFLPVDASSLVYYFYTAEPGISITANGNMATVQVTDGAPHTFTLTVAATDPNTGDSADTSTQLVFQVPTPPLTCIVSATPVVASLYPVLPYFYYYYQITAYVPVMVAPVNPRVTGFWSSAWGYDYSPRGPLGYNVNFFRSQILQPAQETEQVTLDIADDTGRTASCSAYVDVWEY
jgi:hypothetical protein